MQTSVQPFTPRDTSCADASPATVSPAGASAAVVGRGGGVAPTRGNTGRAPLFPPRDADAETRRRWLASSPWPEVVFASAGTI